MIDVKRGHYQIPGKFASTAMGTNAVLLRVFFSVAGFLYLLYFCRRYNDSWTFLIHGTGVDDLGKYIPSHRNVIYLVKTNFNPLGSSCHLQPPSCINSY